MTSAPHKNSELFSDGVAEFHKQLRLRQLHVSVDFWKGLGKPNGANAWKKFTYYQLNSFCTYEAMGEMKGSDWLELVIQPYINYCYFHKSVNPKSRSLYWIG